MSLVLWKYGVPNVMIVVELVETVNDNLEVDSEVYVAGESVYTDVGVKWTEAGMCAGTNAVLLCCNMVM